MKLYNIITFLSTYWRLNSAKPSSDKIATEIDSIPGKEELERKRKTLRNDSLVF